MPVRLYSTLTNRVEDFVPKDAGKVNFFVCGPTVYDLSHAGHAKTYTQFDFIVRYLKRTFDVRYLLNITDVDDKIIARANERGVEPLDLARQFEGEYFEDMEWLHNTSVTDVARAHDFIPQIISQVKRLQVLGAAYELDDGWYFDLSFVENYGALSKRTFESMEDGLSRLEDVSGKRNPGDFVLWKKAKPGEPSWESELGAGRPGWHIEDTAITEHFFGSQYDIHGGAIDLIFPHHEAEIAQMETISGLTPLASTWMHTGLLQVDGEKMAKSLGNFVTIRSLREAWDYRSLRYVFLSQHYRSNLELTDSSMSAADAARKRVEEFYLHASASAETLQVQKLIESTRDAFFEELDNDLNTPAAFGVLFSALRTMNRENLKGGPSAREFLEEVNELFDIYDFEDVPVSSVDEAVVESLISLRNRFKMDKDFAAADRVREHIRTLGFTLEDGAGRTTWRAL